MKRALATPRCSIGKGAVPQRGGEFARARRLRLRPPATQLRNVAPQMREPRRIVAPGLCYRRTQF
jgi:hypothetical protein